MSCHCFFFFSSSINVDRDRKTQGARGRAPSVTTEEMETLKHPFNLTHQVSLRVDLLWSLFRVYSKAFITDSRYVQAGDHKSSECSTMTALGYDIAMSRYQNAGNLSVKVYKPSFLHRSLDLKRLFLSV